MPTTRKANDSIAAKVCLACRSGKCACENNTNISVEEQTAYGSSGNYRRRQIDVSLHGHPIFKAFSDTSGTVPDDAISLTFAGYKKRLTTERLNACLEGAGSKVRVRIRKGVCQAYVGGKSIDLDADAWYDGSTFSSAGLFR